MISLYIEWKEEKNNNNKNFLTFCHISFFSFIPKWTFGSLKKIKTYIYHNIKNDLWSWMNMYSFTVQAAQKKTNHSGNGNLSLLISMNSTIAVNNEKCLLLTLNISKRHRILMKNSSMPNPFWKLKWNLGRKWALLWRWYQQLSENMTVNLRQLKRDYFTANYKFKAFEKFNNHQVQKRRVKSFFFIHGQIDWN